MQKRHKIFWFVASIDPSNAGYRVRTQPIVQALAAHGVEIELLPTKDMFEHMRMLEQEAATVIVAKPNEHVTYLCLKRLKKMGVHIMIDLFDNYLSWSPTLISRNIPYIWLKAIRLADQVIVSTDFLKGFIRKVCDAQVIQIGDPVDTDSDTYEIAQLSANEEKWPAGNVVRLLWFGINGNPYFQAGLEDLVSWKSVVMELAESLHPHQQLELTICTNPHEYITSTLKTFRDAGIHVSYEAWTEEKCDALLASPHGPYQSIPGAVCKDVGVAAALLKNASKERVSELAEQSLNHLREGHNLIRDVAALVPLLSKQREMPVVEKGKKESVLLFSFTDGKTLKAARKLGYVSASFKGNGAELNFDITMSYDNSCDDAVDLACIDMAYELLVQSLQKNKHAEWRRLDHHTIAYEVDGWHFECSDATQSCRVSSKHLHAYLEKTHALYHIRHTHKITESHWLEINSALLGKIFSVINFSDMEFSASENKGWEAFAKSVDTEHMGDIIHLHSLWLEYADRETEWADDLQEQAA